MVPPDSVTFEVVSVVEPPKPTEDGLALKAPMVGGAAVTTTVAETAELVAPAVSVAMAY
jgi:hypothetical protein